MPILLKQGPQAELLQSSQFASEEELERLVSDNPGLLRSAQDPELRLVDKQVTLGESGTLDLLLVSEDGLPIAVEVKLARNGESRREIVAQAVDYISALTELTNDELDAACNGTLEKALRGFEQPSTVVTEAAANEESAFERRWQAVGANLRAGLARLILVLDVAPPSLTRMVRFLAENSQLDIQLAVVDRYLTSGTDGRTVVVPRIVVSAESVIRRSLSALPKESRPALIEAVTIYNASAPKGLEAVGIAPTYRQIRPGDFSKGSRTHYEFYTTASDIGAELHIESDVARPLAAILAPLDGRELPNGHTTLVWDPTWSSGRGRLRAKFPIDAPASHVAGAMTDLVTLTRDSVAKRLAELP